MLPPYFASDTRAGRVDYSSIHSIASEYTTISPGTSPVYHAAGSLVKDKNGYSCNDDYENRITCIYIDNHSNGVYNDVTDSFEYDALGRKIEKVVTGTTTTTTRYYDDDQQIAMQTETVGRLVERYEYDAYGKTRILASDFSLLTSSQYGTPCTFTGRQLDALEELLSRLPQTIPGMKRYLVCFIYSR